jgi:hypothetical protein
MLCILFLFSWLRHYATSRKVAGLNPDEVNEFFFIFPNPSNHTMALGVDSASNRNEYHQIFLGGGGGEAWPTHSADNLTTICEPVV